MPPRICHNFIWDAIVRIDCPINNLLTGRRLPGCKRFANRPLLSLRVNAIFQWFVESYLNRMAEASASSWDVPYFCSQALNFVGHRAHQMYSVQIQDYDWNYSRRSCCDVWSQNFFDPTMDQSLIHPCFLLHTIMTISPE